jgi:hypothetical protein
MMPEAAGGHYDMIVFVWDDGEIANRAPVGIWSTGGNQTGNKASIGRRQAAEFDALYQLR